MEQNETELLINSTLAGEPHKSYVYLISAAQPTALPLFNEIRSIISSVPMPAI
jgi:hypothetical protein